MHPLPQLSQLLTQPGIVGTQAALLGFQLGDTFFGWAAFERLHEPDALVYTAPFAEHIRIEGGGTHQPVREFAAGELRIPAAALAAA